MGMTFFKRINTKITQPNIFRYSHRHSLTKFSNNHIEKVYILRHNNIIINLFGDTQSVDEASWEIKSFAKEKSLLTANIVFNNDILKDILYNNSYLQFLVNRCYNMNCDNLLYLNQDIIYSNKSWIPYNLYVLPNATNRFNTCEFIKNCNKTKFIIYPLAAPIENKRRDIHILID
jgi:hypothetical protein